jgi:hypothetical protein
MSAREVVARAMWDKDRTPDDGTPEWESLRDDDNGEYAMGRDSYRNLADAGLAAMREHLAKAVPACGCTNADCQIDATREAMLKALGDE